MNVSTPRAPVQAPGWIAAAELIGLIFGDPEAKVWFQTFDDHGDNQDLALSKRGRLSDEAIRTWLTGAAKAGAGVFYAPATIGPEGRRAKFTTGYVCNYLDLDGSPLPLEWPGGIEPDIIVQSSDGRYHCYWLLVPGADLDTWRDVQARIAAAHKGDTSMTKPNGVLRLAGFFHQKGKPQRVTIDPGTTVTRRPLSDMVAAYAHVTDYEAPRSRTTSGAAGDVEDDDSPANVEGARREIARLPKPAEGNRNNIGFRVAATCDDYALSRELAIELATEWSESLPDPLDADEIVSLVDHAREYKDSPRGIKKSIDAVDDFADAPAIDPDEIVISGKMPAHVPESRVARSRIIKPTPFVPRDPRSIPLRPFIYDPYYVRGMVTLTAAMGGVGKSSLVMAENVAMALGKPLLGYQPEEDLVVWYFNGEDGQDELDRKLAAICLHYEIDPQDLVGKLFVDSGLRLPIKIAEMSEGVPTIARPIVNQMVEAIRDYKIDHLSLDPFVTTHAVTENDTIAMETVAREWVRIAEATRCSVGIAHHTRKTGGIAVTIEDSRGASALTNVARVRRAINKMSEPQARAAGIPEARCKFFISVNPDYTNVSKPTAGLDWYELASVDIGNNPLQFLPGDNMGVPVPYDYTSLANAPVDDIQHTAVVTAIRAGKWRNSDKAKDWVGIPIAKALGLAMDGDGNKGNRKRVRILIAAWLKDGTLVEYEDQDANRNTRTFIKAP